MIRCLIRSSISRKMGNAGHFRTNVCLPFSTTTNQSNEENKTIKFYFQEKKSGDLIEVKGETGKSVLDIALEYNIDIEGACGGQMACSTCHCVLPQDLYDALPQKQEEEQDMLDLALGLADTSRLCCQIQVSPLLEGKVFQVPEETNNML